MPTSCLHPGIRMDANQIRNDQGRMPAMKREQPRTTGAWPGATRLAPDAKNLRPPGWRPLYRHRVVLLAAVLTTLPVVALADEAIPSLKITDRVEYNTVTGNTSRSIRKQLEGRARADGMPGHASTRSSFEVISRLEEVDGQCRVLNQEIRVEITTELPLWEPEGKVSAELEKEWAQSIARLKRHEAGHRQNALQSTAELQERLQQLEAEKRCLTAQAGIDLALDNVLNRLARREAYLDRLSRDGLRDLPGGGDPRTSVDIDEPEQGAKHRRAGPSRKLPAE